jgi:hypothetical protein
MIEENGEAGESFDDRLDLQRDRASERSARFWQNYRRTNVISGLIRRDALARTSLMRDGSVPAADVRLLAELTLLGKFVELPDALFLQASAPWCP